jgi:hypothetical protein
MKRIAALKAGIGYATIAVGLVALTFPRRFAAAIGLEDAAEPEMIAAFGSRELANGAGLLAPVRFGPFLWMRVIGDVIDLGALALAARKPAADRRLTVIAAIAVTAITVFDLVLALQDEADPD